jgi:ribose transport system permease protein
MKASWAREAARVGVSIRDSALFLPLVIFALIVAVNALVQPGLFQPRILRSNTASFAPLILVAAGQAIIVLSGSLDLSVGTGMSLINCILSAIMTESLGSSALALAVGLAVALCIGLLNGVLVAYLRLPSLIATFATSAIWFGIALLLRPQPGGFVTPWVSTFYYLSLGPVAVPLLIVLAALGGWGLVKRRRLGRYVYAVGSSEEAAYDSGVNAPLVKVWAYVLGWAFVFLAAFAVTAQMSSGDAYMGNPFTLNSVAAVVIGGVSLSGGKGRVLGAMLGGAALSMVINIIYYANVPSVYQEFVKGSIIIVALALTIVYRRRVPGLAGGTR